jgi:hypothetical protein
MSSWSAKAAPSHRHSLAHMNKSPKLQSNSKSLQRRQYGVLVTATAKAQQVMSSMRGFFFLQLGLGKRCRRCHAHEGRAEHRTEQSAKRDACWLERGEAGGKGQSEGRAALTTHEREHSRLACILPRAVSDTSPALQPTPLAWFLALHLQGVHGSSAYPWMDMGLTDMDPAHIGASLCQIVSHRTGFFFSLVLEEFA